MYGSRDGGRSWQVEWYSGGGDSARNGIIKSNLLRFDKDGPAKTMVGPQLMNFGTDLGTFPHSDVKPGKYYTSDDIYPSAAGTGAWALGLDAASGNFTREPVLQGQNISFDFRPYHVRTNGPFQIKFISALIHQLESTGLVPRQPDRPRRGRGWERDA